MYDPLFDHVFDLSYKKIPNLKILIKVDEYKNTIDYSRSNFKYNFV